MMRYLALLRGINVGGKNKIAMPDLKAAFEKCGFENVLTYINSGNILFDSELDEATVKAACEEAITTGFGLNILAAVITAPDLIEALEHAPSWWGSDPDSKHNAILVIPPLTAQDVLKQVGETKPEYEQVAHHGRVIFWSAPLATFSHARWSKIVQNKKAYSAITIRNANTAKKLAELARQ